MKIQSVLILSLLLIANVSFAQITQPKITTSSLKFGQNPLLTIGDQKFREKFTNKPLPEFSLLDINGKRITSQELFGKKIHINFWSITCKYCIQEFSELDSLKKKYGNEFIYIAFAPESTEKVKEVIEKHPLNYIIIADAAQLYENLGIDGYPKNFFVESNGVIKFVTDGSFLKWNSKTKQSESNNYKYYDELMSQLN